MTEEGIFLKCAWRLIPFMGVLYLINFLDRLNVGFAALTMNKDLDFSPSVFGIGAGALFAGYLIFQVPVSMTMERFGARRGIFWIMAVWGLISAGCAFVQGPRSFYMLRFLLGAAEAGFFPGAMFYLTLWFPKAYRARYSAGFVSALAYAGIIGGPLSSFILANADGIAGLHGWQWLFLLEGLPAFLLAFAVLKLLPDGPATAAWLSAEEKSTIATRHAAEPATGERDLIQAIRDPRILALSLASFAHGAALYGPTLWLPLIVQEMGFSNFATGFVVALPYLASAVVMIIWGRSSDRSGERIWHLIFAWLLCAFGLLVGSFAQNHAVQIGGLTLAMVGIFTSITQLMSLPPLFLRGPAAAGGIAVLNTVVSLGGVVAPPVIGMLKEQTGSYGLSMIMIAVGLALSSALVRAFVRDVTPRLVATAELKSEA
ncbi:MAG TPA: MFS transporter [Micropepsaceae bacterium]|nr:MFS transporter [Micropepsaceae bacterium]